MLETLARRVKQTKVHIVPARFYFFAYSFEHRACVTPGSSAISGDLAYQPALLAEEKPVRAIAPGCQDRLLHSLTGWDRVAHEQRILELAAQAGRFGIAKANNTPRRASGDNGESSPQLSLRSYGNRIECSALLGILNAKSCKVKKNVASRWLHRAGQRMSTFPQASRRASFEPFPHEDGFLSEIALYAYSSIFRL